MLLSSTCPFSLCRHLFRGMRRCLYLRGIAVSHLRRLQIGGGMRRNVIARTEIRNSAERLRHGASLSATGGIDDGCVNFRNAATPAVKKRLGRGGVVCRLCRDDMRRRWARRGKPPMLQYEHAAARIQQSAMLGISIISSAIRARPQLCLDRRAISRTRWWPFNTRRSSGMGR